MTTLLLVRHALCDPVPPGLPGRMPGVRLSAAGRQQAERIAQRLRSAPLDRVVSSPLERAMATATPIAAAHGLTVEIEEDLNEIDVGESMPEVQARAAAVVERLSTRVPLGQVVLVSHLDVLRALLCRLLGMPLDHFARLEIAPASLCVVDTGAGGTTVHSIRGAAGADAGH